MTSRDPDKVPVLPSEVIEAAKRRDQKILYVILEPPGDPPSDPPIAFFALVDFLPRIGEEIWTQNSKRCRVEFISHQVIAVGNPDTPTAFALLPTVIATLSENDG